MADSIRDLIVSLSFNAGNFTQTAANIKKQIQEVESEFNALGGKVDGFANTLQGRNAKIQELNDKLKLQKDAVVNYESALKTAQDALANATAEGQLAAAKKVSDAETKLNNAKGDVQVTVDEIARLSRELNALKLTNLGSTLTSMGKQMQTFGRRFSMYVGAPLAALGVKSYNLALDYESAMVTMQKTVEETGKTTYQSISDSFLAYSEEAPVAYTELMNLAGAAGAMGVGADQVVDFVKSIAMISSTADDLDATSGATALAEFLNITDQGNFSNVERVASAVTALGNNLSTTEGQLMEMAQRMASTGELAGMSQEDILALAASFTSVGIEAEAGGSAAGKLMKQMQLAAETGSKVFAEGAGYKEKAVEYREQAKAFEETSNEYKLLISAAEYAEVMTADNAYQLYQDLEQMPKGWKVYADSMNLTVADAKKMVEAGIDLERFADVMGITKEQFVEGWDTDAGGSVLEFFKGLNRLEKEQGEETILSKLDEMGLTEIRLSNLIAAAASNPELFQRAMEISKEAYNANTALTEEAEKRYKTAESFQMMQLNQIENAGADVGENVKDAVQPIIDVVSNLVSEFGKLDETTQTRWVVVAGALVALGPAALGIGKVVSSVGSLVSYVGKLQAGAASNFSGLTSVLTNPATWGLVAGVGVIALVDYIDSLPTKAESIALALKDIKINIDPNLLKQTLDDIAEVQAASDALDKDKMAQYAGEAQLVKAGYGTQDMFGHALGYEKAMYEQNLALDMAPGIAAIAEKNAAILAADSAGNDALAASLTVERDRMAKEQAELANIIRANYQLQVEALIGGMMESQPEAKAALEKANDAYGLVPTFLAMNKEFYSSKQYEQYGVLEKMYTQDFLDKYFGGKTLAELVPKVAGVFKYGDVEKLFAETENLLNQAILDGTYTTNEGELGYNLLNQLLGAGVLDNIDMTNVQGSLAGMLKTIDYKAAVAGAGKEISAFGKYLNEGLAGGITENSGIASATMKNIRDDILTDLHAAFEMKSPSKLMAREGANISKGIADGILQAAPEAVHAMNILGAQLRSAAAIQGALAASAFASAFRSGMGGSYGYHGGAGEATAKGGISSTANLYAGGITINNGADAKSLVRLLSNENKRQLRGAGVRS